MKLTFGIATEDDALELALLHQDAAIGAGAGGFYAKRGYRETGHFTYRGAPLVYYELLLD
jgi:hypothetical protein